MNLKTIRYPKFLENDTNYERIKQGLIDSVQPLWEKSEILIPQLPFSKPLVDIIKTAIKTKMLSRGHEGIERKLCFELKGLKNADQKSNVTRGQRISRLIILSNDGAQRFYRKIEKLLRNYSPRVMAIMINADSIEIGKALYGQEKLSKAMLIEHKELVSLVLKTIISD